MTYRKFSPSSRLLKIPLMLLALILVPLALTFSLARLPFARRRIDKLAGVLKREWLPREKYIYVGFYSEFPLAGFVRKNVIKQHNRNIIWDEWDEKAKQWKSSEPEDSNRVTAFWQDLGKSFDDEPMLIIAFYGPDNFKISFENNNLHQFLLADDQSIVYNGKKIDTKMAEKQIGQVVSEALASWSKPS